MECTSTQLYIGENCPDGIPNSSFNIHQLGSDCRCSGEVFLEVAQHCSVILFWLAAHDMDQGHLLHAVTLFNECVDAPQLGERGPNTLEGDIHVPFLGGGEQHQHQQCEKHQVATIAYADVLLQEAFGEGVMLDVGSPRWLGWQGGCPDDACCAWRMNVSILGRASVGTLLGRWARRAMVAVGRWHS